MSEGVDYREQAARWVERLQRDKVPESVRSEFEAWRKGRPEHAEAYGQLERFSATLKRFGETPAMLALRHEAALRLTRHRHHTLSWRWVSAAALAALLICGGIASLTIPGLPAELLSWARALAPQGNRLLTGTGERLAVTLSDGSQVTLDTQSELEIAFASSERLVRLRRGQAYFEVAKDKKHPFVVEVRGRRLVAVGTAFDVRLEPDSFQVTMVEGTVRVEPDVGVRPSSAAVPQPATQRADGTAAGAAPEVLLSAGEQLVIASGSPGRVGSADPERATSWRRGQLIFEGVRLGDAVAELNRYSRKKITLVDPALADIRISGSFATGQPQVFVEAVTSYFPIAVSSENSDTVLLEARRP